MQTAVQEAPPIQYAKTPDGVDIAYSARGEGLPVVFLPFHFNHLNFRWRMPWLRDVSNHARVVAYDSREQGVSSRNLGRETSVADFRCDLETVIEAVGLERFVLAAYGGFAHVAVRYAVDNPERIHGLVLICTAESFASYPWLSMLPLVEDNWELFLRLATKGAPEALVDDVIRDFKTSTSPAEFTRMIRGFAASDISQDLPKLRTPTLLLHSLKQHWLSPEEGVKTAARIPGSRIFFPEQGETEPEPIQGARAIAEFLNELPPLESNFQDLASTRPVELSPRQTEVLRLITEGKTTREIARVLVLSERTVERHIADLYARTGVHNRAEATAYALSRGIES